MLNPLSILKVHALRDFASKIVVSRLFSEKLCSWQEKLVYTQQTNTHKVFPSQTGYNKRPRTTKFLRTSQDQSHAKPPTSGVLKSLITLGFLPQPHQKKHWAQHKTPNMHKLLENKQRVIQGLCLECFIPIKELHTIRRNKGYWGLVRPQPRC